MAKTRSKSSIVYGSAVQIAPKNKEIGIRGKLPEWIKHYLRKRKQGVLIDGMTSEWMPVTSGVPKTMSSSVFRYINDIDLCLNNFISQFGDDTNIGDVVPSE